jgi:hypothetical protein
MTRRSQTPHVRNSPPPPFFSRWFISYPARSIHPSTQKIEITQKEKEKINERVAGCFVTAHPPLSLSIRPPSQKRLARLVPLTVRADMPVCWLLPVCLCALVVAAGTVLG